MMSLPNELKDILDDFQKAPMTFLKNKNLQYLGNVLGAF